MSAGSITRRVAIVTGAAQGIGESIALRFADDGLDLGINDLPSQATKLESVAEALRAKGARVITLLADVSDEDAVKGIVDKTVEELGGLDVMVANAGIACPSTFLEATLETFDKVWSVNVQGVMLCYKYAAIQMIKQGRGGRLLSASSIAAKKGQTFLPAYSMSKHAVRGMSHSAAEELAQHNITVNGFAPGFIMTPMVYLADDEKNGGPGSTIKKRVGYGPSAPDAGPEVVASLVSFLARPESHFITGQTYGVDGGIILD